MTDNKPGGSFREMFRGLGQSGTTLIKRGTAMGPLIPALFIVPILLFFAWLLDNTLVCREIPVLSTLCVGVAFFIVFH